MKSQIKQWVLALPPWARWIGRAVFKLFGLAADMWFYFFIGMLISGFAFAIALVALTPDGLASMIGGWLARACRIGLSCNFSFLMASFAATNVFLIWMIMMSAAALRWAPFAIQDEDDALADKLQDVVAGQDYMVGMLHTIKGRLPPAPDEVDGAQAAAELVVAHAMKVTEAGNGSQV